MPTAQELQRENEELKRENARLRVDATARVKAREEELAQQFQARMEEVNRLHEEEVEQLKLEQKLLIERVFAHKSERYIDDPSQLLLSLSSEDEEFNQQVQDAVDGLLIAADEVDEDDGPKKRKRRSNKQGSGKFPDHLDKKVVDVDLSDDEKADLKHIGYDAVQKLHMKRPEFWVVETRFHKYVDPSKQKPGVMSPPREESTGFVKGDHYDSSVVAELLTGRFGYHLPYYRLQDTFSAAGWTPSRSTLENLKSSAADLITPFYLYLVTCVLQDSVVATDDTGVKLLLPKTLPGVDHDDPKSSRTHEVLQDAIESGKKHINSKMWAYRGVSVPINVFDFTVSRHRDGPDLFLIDSGYSGTLLGDAYGANAGIEMRSSGEIIHAACNAHARRGFKEAMPTHAMHGRFFLSCFHELYDIEDRGAALNDPEGLLSLRQRESRVVWDRMRDYITTKTLDLLPKDKMQGAISYLCNQWDALTRHLEDPSIPIDNNECEQLMKQIAISRKNWLFLGSVKSGNETARILSVVSSAVRNDLHVSAYLQSLLDALLSGSTDYESLRPDVWAQNHPEYIREYRTAERTARERRKREQRAIRRLLKESAADAQTAQN